MPRTAFALLCTVLIVTTGCLGVFDRRPPSDDRAVEARERFAAAVDDADSYRFESRIGVVATAGDESRSVRATGEGVVSRSERRIRSTGESGGDHRRSYTRNYTAYRECAEPWGGWGVDELDESTPWVEYTPLGRYRAILNDSRVYWGGTETVDGTETVVVVAHPTKEALTSTTSSRAGTDLGGVDLKNATLKLWLDRESDLPVRSLLRIEIERGGATGTATVRTTYADYGAPVNVSTPAGFYGERYELGCPGA